MILDKVSLSPHVNLEQLESESGLARVSDPDLRSLAPGHSFCDVISAAVGYIVAAGLAWLLPQATLQHCTNLGQ